MSGIFGGGGGSNKPPAYRQAGREDFMYAKNGSASYTTKFDQDRASAKQTIYDNYNKSVLDYESKMKQYDSDVASSSGAGANITKPGKPAKLTDAQVDAQIRGRVANSPILEQQTSLPEVKLMEKRKTAARAGGRKATILSNNGAQA